MTARQLPRIWVGYEERVPHWAWDGDWEFYDQASPGSVGLIKADVFVGGSGPRPTINPAEMGTIATCREVDWT